MTIEDMFAVMQEVEDYSFATVDEEGSPRVRIISALHYEPDAIYFYTARGKNFAHELENNGKLEILAYNPKRNHYVRLSCKAEVVPEDEQRKWIDKQFEEQSYLFNVYPGDSNDIGIMFVIRSGEFEYFDLSTHPITRETVSWSGAPVHAKGFRIGEDCIGCGTCYEVCPQHDVFESGDREDLGADTPYVIDPEHCLHCGRCYENCPVQAIERLEGYVA